MISITKAAIAEFGLFATGRKAQLDLPQFVNLVRKLTGPDKHDLKFLGRIFAENEGEKLSKDDFSVIVKKFGIRRFKGAIDLKECKFSDAQAAPSNYVNAHEVCLFD